MYNRKKLQVQAHTSLHDSYPSTGVSDSIYKALGVILVGKKQPSFLYYFDLVSLTLQILCIL